MLLLLKLAVILFPLVFAGSDGLGSPLSQAYPINDGEIDEINDGEIDENEDDDEQLIDADVDLNAHGRPARRTAAPAEPQRQGEVEVLATPELRKKKRRKDQIDRRANDKTKKATSVDKLRIGIECANVHKQYHVKLDNLGEPSTLGNEVKVFLDECVVHKYCLFEALDFPGTANCSSTNLSRLPLNEEDLEEIDFDNLTPLAAITGTESNFCNAISVDDFNFILGIKVRNYLREAGHPDVSVYFVKQESLHSSIKSNRDLTARFISDNFDVWMGSNGRFYRSQRPIHPRNPLGYSFSEDYHSVMAYDLNAIHHMMTIPPKELDCFLFDKLKLNRVVAHLKLPYIEGTLPWKANIYGTELEGSTGQDNLSIAALDYDNWNRLFCVASHLLSRVESGNYCKDIGDVTSVDAVHSSGLVLKPTRGCGGQGIIFLFPQAGSTPQLPNVKAETISGEEITVPPSEMTKKLGCTVTYTFEIFHKACRDNQESVFFRIFRKNKADVLYSVSSKVQADGYAQVQAVKRYIKKTKDKRATFCNAIVSAIEENTHLNTKEGEGYPISGVVLRADYFTVKIWKERTKSGDDFVDYFVLNELHVFPRCYSYLTNAEHEEQVNLLASAYGNYLKAHFKPANI